jgi:hypothetical protein
MLPYAAAELTISADGEEGGAARKTNRAAGSSIPVMGPSLRTVKRGSGRAQAKAGFSRFITTFIVAVEDE